MCLYQKTLFAVFLRYGFILAGQNESHANFCIG
jgi:sRNA-binding regulator protein Hfq